MKNKLLKFFRNFAIFLTITGLLFSNIPFYALTGLIDSYKKTSGIVDRMWLIQHENNPNVVDKFASLRDVAEKMKIRQARAAVLTIVLNNRQTILTDGTSWTVPADWTSGNNKIEVIGGGGSGFTDTTGLAGSGGGGGGAYSQITNLTLTPGATVTYQIGNGGKNGALNGGDTFFNRTAGSAGTCVDTTSICAKGGTGATSVTGAAGGVGTSGTGTVRNNGGTGGTGNTTGDTGGGGGGAAGPGAVGKTGGNGGALAGGGSGGGGGNGGVSSTAGTAGSTTIGGAGGAGNLGTGGGTAGSAAAGGNGTTSGAGGGGGDSTFSGGNGFAGTDFFSGATVGSGGGGGGASSTATVGVGGNGGLYGAGGGGGRYGGKGAPGVIVITYNGLTPTKTQWTVPSDWDSANNTIEVIGAGGAAFSAAQGSGTGGGGGGAYSKATNVTLTPGATVAYSIGNGGRKTVVSFGAGVTGGDTYLCNATTNCASIAGTAVVAGAKGGTGATSLTGATGGAAASGFPVAGTRWSGGAGGTGNVTGDSGGGGGGAGGASQDGKVGGIGYTAASGGGGGGGGAGDDSGVNSTVGGAGVAANGGAGGQGPLGTGSGTAGANGSGGNATVGTGAGGGGGDAASVAGPFNGGDGATGSATTYGGGGGGGTGDNNLVATGALFGGEGGHYGGGGGAGLVQGFGGNGVIVITYTQLVLSTTLATGSDPGAGIIIAPGAVAQDVDLFTLQTNSGTESVTTVTVNLSTNSGVGTLAITDNANAVLGSIGGGIGTGIVTGSNAISVAGMSAVSGSATTFKVRVTPLLHANMLAPDGADYSITAPVTSWAGSGGYTHTGSDTNTNALTIDNNSPAATTGANATAGDTQVDVGWTPPVDGDFDRVFIYCKTSSMIGGEAPAEGSDLTVDGAACDGTARLKYKGAASPQTITGLSNGTLYYFRIYARDLNGNFTAYSVTEQVSAMPAPQGPDATSYTNTETALNFANCGTTGCGGRIGQQITITGTNFGTPANKDVCTSGATNGCVRIANYTVPAANISSWIATQIVFTIPSGITVYGGSGTTCGGADGNGICVTQNANNDPGGALQFFVFPDITSTTPGAATGAKELDNITVDGTRFGSSAGTVEFINCAGGAVSATVGTWGDTQLQNIQVPAGIDNNDDSCDIKITRAAGTGSKTDTSNNTADNLGTFVILPNITSVLSNASSARECVATDTDCDDTDTDGLIKLIGNHFGASPGTVQFTGAFGSISATIHATVGGACDVGGWAAAATSVCIETSPTISDSVNVGDITLTRTGDSKTYNRTSYRIIPRITSITPSADGVNPDTRFINGNHFCQSGSCLSAASWNAANDDGDDVKFGTTNATVTGTPSDTVVDVTVPSLTPGNYSVTLSSNSGSSYTSNGKNFSYLDNTPVNPSSLNQYQSNCSTVITDETTTTSSTVCLKAAVTGGVTDGTLYLQVEVKASGVAFSDTDNTSQSAGTSAPAGGTESVSVTPGQGIFKWRARTCHYNNIGTHNLTCTGTGDYPSAAWVEFEEMTVDDPTNDFTIDSNGPVISNISSGTPGEFSVTITWDTNEPATTNISYGASTGTYIFNVPSSLDTIANNTSHSIPVTSNLNCGTTYYYIIKSADVQSTLTTSSEQTFTTGTCNPRVMKSVEFDWVEETDKLSNIATPTIISQVNKSPFTANIQESSDPEFTIRNAVLEMRGVIRGSGGGAPTVNLWINSAATPTPIDLPNTTIPQAFTIRYNIPAPATNLNIAPLSVSSNIVRYQFGGGVSEATLINVKLIITYDYTP